MKHYWLTFYSTQGNAPYEPQKNKSLLNFKQNFFNFCLKLENYVMYDMVQNILCRTGLTNFCKYVYYCQGPNETIVISHLIGQNQQVIQSISLYDFAIGLRMRSSRRLWTCTSLVAWRSPCASPRKPSASPQRTSSVRATRGSRTRMVMMTLRSKVGCGILVNWHRHFCSSVSHNAVKLLKTGK